MFVAISPTILKLKISQMCSFSLNLANILSICKKSWILNCLFTKIGSYKQIHTCTRENCFKNCFIFSDNAKQKCTSILTQDCDKQVSAFHFAVIYAHPILQIRHSAGTVYISTERIATAGERAVTRIHIDAGGEKMTGD